MTAQEFVPEPLAEAELDLEHLSAGPSGADSGFELALDDSSMAVLPGGPSTPATPASPSKLGSGLLDDLFAEFRDEVEEPQPGGGGDLETRYNMGVAFKEMALYDEAIGEFQKVHQIAEAAKDYSHLVQCCSLLAICFIEKGLPLLAVNWYQTALDSPCADAESELALLYEIGAAYEMAGNRSAALKSFMDVYSRNIDYRNVAERIRELQQGS
ncbi:MAG: tetratricopeptide repeat protein [Acidobacteria bacterium]|nr:tetratricopeptide repeat protein [Acidobacteriota bacterium]